jgi:hypothetical protein
MAAAAAICATATWHSRLSYPRKAPWRVLPPHPNPLPAPGERERPGACPLAPHKRGEGGAHRDRDGRGEGQELDTGAGEIHTPGGAGGGAGPRRVTPCRARRRCAAGKSAEDFPGRRAVSEHAQRHVQVRRLYVFYQADLVQGRRRHDQPQRLVQTFRPAGLTGIMAQRIKGLGFR